METPKTTPKDFFLWLGVIIALYVSVGSFVTLLFTYIEHLFGTKLLIGYNVYSGGVSFAIASLIVLFPTYLILTRLLNNEVRKVPAKGDLWVRRWAVFLTVFGAGLGLIIDLVVLLTTFLSGDELTTVFLLKVLSVFVIFGGVFYYYLQDFRGVWQENERRSKVIGSIVAAIVVVSIIAGFFILGSPATQRELRNDNQRIQDLRNLQAQVTNYYRDTEELPATLSDMRDDILGSYMPTDPATGADYGYTPTGALTFELCATFERALPDVDTTNLDQTDWEVREYLTVREEWPHEAGETCFEREINPDRLDAAKGPVPLREF